MDFNLFSFLFFFFSMKTLSETRNLVFRFVVVIIVSCCFSIFFFIIMGFWLKIFLTLYRCAWNNRFTTTCGDSFSLWGTLSLEPSGSPLVCGLHWDWNLQGVLWSVGYFETWTLGDSFTLWGTLKLEPSGSPLVCGVQWNLNLQGVL